MEFSCVLFNYNSCALKFCTAVLGFFKINKPSHNGINGPPTVVHCFNGVECMVNVCVHCTPLWTHCSLISMDGELYKKQNRILCRSENHADLECHNRDSDKLAGMPLLPNGWHVCWLASVNIVESKVIWHIKSGVCVGFRRTACSHLQTLPPYSSFFLEVLTLHKTWREKILSCSMFTLQH